MLNSTEHGISTAHKTEMLKNKDFSYFQTAFIMLMNVTLSTIVGILTFMSMINFMKILKEYLYKQCRPRWNAALCIKSDLQTKEYDFF